MKDTFTIFTELVSIPSPSGSEANVAKYIKKYAKKLGLKTTIDNSGTKTKSNSGNLIIKLEGGATAILFVSHMDTVEKGGIAIKPIREDDRITSDGKTILGADNKAAIAASLASMPEIKRMKNRPTVFFVFSTREENGIMGVVHLKLGSRVDYTFVIDGNGEIGSFIEKAMGHFPFSLEIYGKEAHAATEPEKGRNAIKAAGLFLNNIKLGKDASGDTLNIGMINGGSNTNVIPGKVTLEGEVRSFSYKKMLKKVEEIERAAKRACSSTGCSFELIRKFNEGAMPFSAASDKNLINLAKSATKSIGLKFNLRQLHATFEGSILANRGYNVIGVGAGVKMPHSTQESVSLKDLDNLKKLIISIISTASKSKRDSLVMFWKA